MKTRRPQPRCRRPRSEPLESRLLLSASYTVADLGAGTDYVELNNNYALGYTGTVESPTGLLIYNLNTQATLSGSSAPAVPPGTIGLVGNDNQILAGTVNTNYQNPNAAPSDQAFVLDESSSSPTPTTLQVIPSVGLDPTENSVADINDNGQILGTAGEAIGGGLQSYDEAVIWSTSGAILQTFSEPGVNIEPDYINSTGVICGTDDQNNMQNAFILQGSLPHNIASGVGEVEGFNDQDHVLYSPSSGSNPESFLYNGSTSVDLGSFVAQGLNDSDAVVGYTTDKGMNNEAIIEQNGTITALNSLLPANSGWNLMQANAINTAGAIIGTGTYQGAVSSFLLMPTASYTLYPARLTGLPKQNLSSSIVGSFNYPGGFPASQFTASINWDDGSAAGTGTITLANGLYSISAQHAYDTGKTYNITVSINGPNSSNATINSTAVVQQTFIVNSNGTLPDSDLSDNIASTGNMLKNGQPEVTLLAALQQANANGGAVIQFDLPKNELNIPLADSSAYQLNGNITLQGSDGVTLAGPARGAAGGSQNGLTLSGNNNIVTNLAINNMPGWGIQISGGGGNAIEGCTFNLDGSLSEYTVVDASASGGDLDISSSSNNQIGAAHGGNDFVGESVVGRDQGYSTAGTELEIDGTASTGNVIQANTFAGKRGPLPKGAETEQTHLQTASADYGIIDSGVGNTIGGGGLGNSFKNLVYGISIQDSGGSAANNVVAGNAFDKCDNGIADGSATNTIGGSGGGSGNKLISCDTGILLQNNADGSVVQSNVITKSIVGVDINASNTIIGSAAGTDGNIISQGHGPTRGGPALVAAAVAVVGGTGNTIIGNSIFNNAGLGIDLAGNTPLSDPNGSISAPIFGFFADKNGTISGGSAQVSFSLNTSNKASYTISVYACAPVNKAKPLGQGRTFLGNYTISTDFNGMFTGSINVPATRGFITMTTTGPDGSTSEFSNGVDLNLLPHT